MLIPRKVKHRKQHHPSRTGAAKGGTQVSFGDYGIQALEPAYVTNRQIESARIAMTRHIRRGGKVWINIFPDRPLTKKPAETRMGSGKGSPEWWIANVKPGRVMFEMSLPERGDRPRGAASRDHKLPMKCRIVTREEVSSDGRGNPASELRELDDEELVDRGCARRRKSCSTCGSRWRPASWTTTAGCGPSATTSRGSTRSCVSASSGRRRRRPTSSQRDSERGRSMT